MKLAVISIGWNRPEMQDLSLKYLSQCRGAQDTSMFMFIDGDGMARNDAIDLHKKYMKNFKNTECIIRSSNWGLSKNILSALVEVAGGDYKAVCLLEDDVLVSKDFLEFHKACHSMNLEKMRVFSVSGYAQAQRRLEKGNYDEVIRLYRWYLPDGVSFSKSRINLIKPYATNKYYNNKRTRIDKMKAGILKSDKEFARKQWVGGSYKHIEQAGLLNAIRAFFNLFSIAPYRSRCQDIGMYGFHQHERKNFGVDIKDSNTWRQSKWYSTCWSEDHQWNQLNIINPGGKQYANGNSVHRVEQS